MEGYEDRCGGNERKDFKKYLLLKSRGGRCGGLERTDFEEFLLWDRCGGH